jgi:regulation of enolase protein 1 (concanavalin A-like superfamily)
MTFLKFKSLLVALVCGMLLTTAMSPGIPFTRMTAGSATAIPGQEADTDLPSLGSYLNQDGSPLFSPEAPLAPVNIWSALGDGLNGSVNAIAVEGPNVYVGGSFTNAGGIEQADYLARWNVVDNNWHDVGGGLNAEVTSLAVEGQRVYVGGHYTNAGGDSNARGIAFWDGSSWNNLGTGIDCSESFTFVDAIVIMGSDVFVGGFFANAGGISGANHIARWDGSTWHAMGTFTNVVYTIDIIGENVYAGGSFTGADGVPDTSKIARWNMVDTSWHTVGSGITGSGAVYGIAHAGANLFVGGSFTNAGGDADADYIACWDGSTWNSLGSAHPGTTVYAVATVGGDLYVGGAFSGYISHWDGSTWYPVGDGLNNWVTAITIEGSNIYVGGTFTSAGGNPFASKIARWDISESAPGWNALGSGLSDTVTALAHQGSDVFTGGFFLNAGGSDEADYLARWDGSSWQALGSGVNGGVRTITVEGPDVYVGGDFTNAGGITGTNHIARWSMIDNSWHALGPGLGATVYSIEVVGDDVYAGGDFQNAGGDPSADGLASWDGSTWNPIGGGIPPGYSVLAIKVVGSDLYVGGYFLDAGGIDEADYLARWDGSAWHALGSGLNNMVWAIEVAGSDVYIGGDFSSAGGIPGTAHVARWDGSAWNALDNGLNSWVFDLNIVGPDLYVGGHFTDAGGNSDGDSLAFWDGTNWNAIGGIPAISVNDIDIVGADLYAGGLFYNAGGNENADYVARWGAVPDDGLTTDYDYYWLEDFGSTDLHPLWSWVREDGSHWSLSSNPGAMRITTQPGSIFEVEDSNNQNNILLMRAPDGDFQLTSQIGINPSESFHNAGLLVYQDDDNFISVVRGYGSSEPHDKVYFEYEVGGVFTYDWIVESSDSLHLRITRTGNDYSGSYSLDGSTWIPIGSGTVELNDPMVGLAASSGPGLTEIPADFESFTLEGNFPAFENPWQDDFAAVTIDPQWKWINENPSYWSLTANPGFLRIGTGPYGVGGENLLVQKMPPFDFWMETQVAFEPLSDFQIAGLALAADGDNLLTLGRAFCDACGGNGIYFDHYEDSIFTGDNFKTFVPETDEAYLRVLRQGATYFGFYRNATSKWQLIGTHVWGGALDLTAIGVSAAQGYDGYADADFEYFEVTPGIQPCYLPLTIKP